MKVAFFDTHGYERSAFDAANASHRHAITFLEPRLTPETAILARGHDVACAFVTSVVNRDTLQRLLEQGVRLIALRSTGFNHVDMRAAKDLELPIVRVPEYSPHAVAEHAAALVLALNRKIHRAYARVREWDFSLDGLIGFDLHGKTVGLIGTGRIGGVAARIFHGFGCKILACDVRPEPALSQALGVRYTAEPMDVFGGADIVSLHVPLTPDTYHTVDAVALAAMKPGAMLINTGRGGLIDSRALLEALKSGHLGAAGLDVYEEEEGVFSEDLSEAILQDDVLARLLTFPNVIVTAHQGFLTHEALARIADVTLANITEFARGRPLQNQVFAEDVLSAA